MNLNSPSGPLDQPFKDEGDEFFVGVDERRQPAELPPGFVAQAKGYRFRDGRARPRLGMPICRWLPTDGMTPFTTPLGIAQFADPTDGLEWIVIAADGGVWKTRPNNVAKAVPLPAGVTLTADSFTMFVQCMNVLILLRGENYAPLVCVDLDTGFTTIPDTSVDDTTLPIPNASYGLYFANRLLLVNNRDNVAVSAVLDYTRYIPAINAFKINEGNNDALLAIQPMGKSTLIMFKDQSTLRVSNVEADWTNAVLDDVTRGFGCVAPFSVTQVGSDLYWWSEQGVVSVELTELNETQARPDRLSDPMSKTLARINPLYVDKIQGAVDPVTGNLLFAVPLDDAKLYGPELVDPTTRYSTGGATTDPITGLQYKTHTITVTTGQRYRYVQGMNELYLVNGTQTLAGDTEFVAQGASITLQGIADTGLTASLTAVTAEGVLNGVMVFDTSTKAWAGCDEAPGVLLVKQFVKVTLLGKQRLAFLTADGWLRLWEEGYEDEVLAAIPVPYVDLYVMSQPAQNDTIQVNQSGGPIYIFAHQELTNNASRQWACSTAALARVNLWLNSGFGYSPNASSSQWPCPNTTAVAIDGGVRFYSTNGVLPDVSIVGTWAFLDAHSGSEIQSIPVPHALTTRGYRMQDLDRKRYLELLASIATWHPSYTVTTIADGVANETQYVVNQSRDNTQYDDVFGKTAWDPSNVNNDHGTKGRQDYAVTADLTSTDDAPVNLGFNLGSGVNVDQHQEQMHRIPTSEQGSRLQLRFENAAGRLEIQSILLGAIEGEKEGGLRAA